MFCLIGQQLTDARRSDEPLCLVMLDTFTQLTRLDTPESLTENAGLTILGTSDKASRENAKQALRKGLAQAVARQQAKQQRFMKAAPSRHSRFGTMIVGPSKFKGGRKALVRNPFSGEHSLPSDKLNSTAGRQAVQDRGEGGKDIAQFDVGLMYSSYLSYLSGDLPVRAFPPALSVCFVVQANECICRTPFAGP